MKIIVYNVEHGFCSIIVADNNKLLVVDAGSNNTSGFKPSDVIKKSGYSQIELFIVSNYDEDHVSDLVEIRPLIKHFRCNKSISTECLKQLKIKSGGIGNGINELLKLRNNSSPSKVQADLGGITYTCFHNNYPDFNDTNNLSLLTFIKYKNLTVCIPGDLESSGWDPLLKSENIQRCLSETNIFVASHHGRENGLCEDVFKFAHPDIIIISDGPIQYDTQKVDYSRYAKGLDLGNDRYVLTTRKDGDIIIEYDDELFRNISATNWNKKYAF